MEAHADVAQLVEHQLPKLRVAGSNPVVRFEKAPLRRVFVCRRSWMASSSLSLSLTAIQDRQQMRLTGYRRARKESNGAIEQGQRFSRRTQRGGKDTSGIRP